MSTKNQLQHFRSRYLSRLYQPFLTTRKLNLAHTIHRPAKVVPTNSPLIMLHGLFGSKQNNRSIRQRRALALRLNTVVYALDLRNHGDSPHDTEHTYEAMASDVEQFVRQNELLSAILVGHSMGAKVAMMVALHWPSLLKALVLVDNAPVQSQLSNNFNQYVEAYKEMETSSMLTRGQADEIMQRYESDINIRQFLLSNLIREQSSPPDFKLRIPVTVLSKSLQAMGSFPYRDSSEKTYNGPTLCIRGANSPYVQDSMIPQLRKFFPNVVLRTIDCGHWIVAEKPDEFKYAVCSFLDSIDR